MSNENMGHLRDNSRTPGVPDDQKQHHPVGQLKQLAEQVLKQSVPLSRPYMSGTVGHPATGPKKGGHAWGTGGTDELSESMRRLVESASVLLAISEDGDLRIVRTDPEAHKAVLDGFTI